MTDRHGSSAWLWKITARSRLGPSTAWLSTMTVPSDGASRPARMLSTVVLPQPEWPMMQVKSPRRIDSHRSSNTVVTLPAAAGKRLVMPSIEMNLSSDTASLRKRDEAGGARKQLVEDHADDADHQDRGDHIGDRKVVPLVPDEVADAGTADQHLGRHDHQPGDADRDAHSGEDGWRRRRQDDGEGAPEGADLERARDVEPLLAHGRDPKG